ncbi:MAG TPA: ferritin-like domain-containing protein [Kofleriaceae bacterium]|jgi:hypothetical protein
MLRDTIWLREQLRLALAMFPLIAGGCDVIDSAQAQPPIHMPSCPSGDFCAPAKAVRPLATNKVTKLGCPVELEEHHDDTNKDGLPTFSTANLDGEATKQSRAAHKAKPDDCCYQWMERCPGGRSLLGATSEPIVAATRAGIAWGRDARACELAPALREALAAGWLADALAEHASIASFARATLELLAVGAPPELIAETQRASLDEIEHARAAFALAARYGGRPVEPGALAIAAPRGGGTSRVARDVLVEGCIGETIAALCVSRAAAACEDAELAATLRAIAGDEARHAALAWKTVAWAVAAHGGTLVAELRAVAAEVRVASLRGELPAAEPLAAALAAHGRLDERARARAVRDAWREILDPTLARLG